MRARNRDNARRTRKRKKLYIAFLNKALEALENVLNPREPEAVKTEINVDNGSSSSSVDVPADDGVEDDDNSSPSVILANRLQTMRSFIIKIITIYRFRNVCTSVRTRHLTLYATTSA